MKSVTRWARLLSLLLKKLILNTRKMRPLQFQCLVVHFRCIEPGEEKNLDFYDGLLRYLLSSAGQSAHFGLIGRQWLAGNSEGHRGNSNFLLPMGFYN